MRFRADGAEWVAEWPNAGVALRCPVPGPQRSEDAEGGTWHHAGDVSVFVPHHGDLLTIAGAFDGVVDLDPSRSSRLVNGYQSWDYSGVRPASEGGHTWWGGAVTDTTTGAGFAYHAATAHRLATSFRTQPAGQEIAVAAVQGEAPVLTPNPPGWGFFVSEATPIPGAARARVGQEHLVVTAAPDAADAMEAVAGAAGAAMGARTWDGPAICGWESWYHYGFSVDPGIVLENARLLVDRFGEPFRTVQIDDGWQHAYGAWEPRGAWPDDLAVLTSELRALGCRPGLWLAPFMVAPGQGPDPSWLVGDPDAAGAPLVDPLMGRHGLDGTHPDALEWLHELGRRVRRWRFEMVKLDFLYIGAQVGSRHDGAATGTEALRRGLAAFVEGVGPDVYVLGCGTPLLPSTGVCHGVRIGGDLAAPVTWPFPEVVPFDPDDGWAGILPQARNAAARWWTHHRLFDNDPDVVMAVGPPEGPPYSTEEARVLATFAALTGGPYFMADDLGALAREKRGVLEDPEITGLAWGPGDRPDDVLRVVDDAPDADYFTAPTALPRTWAGHEFDWAARRVRPVSAG